MPFNKSSIFCCKIIITCYLLQVICANLINLAAIFLHIHCFTVFSMFFRTRLCIICQRPVKNSIGMTRQFAAKVIIQADKPQPVLPYLKGERNGKNKKCLGKQTPLVRPCDAYKGSCRNARMLCPSCHRLCCNRQSYRAVLMRRVFSAFILLLLTLALIIGFCSCRYGDSSRQNNNGRKAAEQDAVSGGQSTVERAYSHLEYSLPNTASNPNNNVG